MRTRRKKVLQSIARSLTEVLQDLRITEDDCHTLDGLLLEAQFEVDDSFQDRLVGRVFCAMHHHYEKHDELVRYDEVITENLASRIVSKGIEKLYARSPATCKSEHGVCARCYGCKPGTEQLVDVGERVGVLAVKSLAEGLSIVADSKRWPHHPQPRSHLGMTGEFKRVSKAVTDGIVKFPDGLVIFEAKGEWYAAGAYSGYISLVDKQGYLKGEHPVRTGAKVCVKDGEAVKVNQIITEAHPEQECIRTDIGGTVQFENFVGVFERKNKKTGLSETVVAHLPRLAREIWPTIVVKPSDPSLPEEKRFPIPEWYRIRLGEGDTVEPGDVLAYGRYYGIPAGRIRAFPRAVELLEARIPRKKAILSEIDGVLRFDKLFKKSYRIKVVNEKDDIVAAYSIPLGAELDPSTREGDFFLAGDPLTRGEMSPHDVLLILGEKRLMEHFTSEMQLIFAWCGTGIHGPELEMVLRRTMRWMTIDEIGDSQFTPGELVDKFIVQRENERLQEAGLIPANARPALVGITKAAQLLRSSGGQ